MKKFRRCTRRFILSLLAVSVFVPIFLQSGRHLHLTYDVSTADIEDLSTIKYKKDVLNLRTINQDESEEVNEPASVVYKAENSSSSVSYSDKKTNFDEPRNLGGIVNLSKRNGTIHDAREDNQHKKPEKSMSSSTQKEAYKEKLVPHDRNVRSLSRRVIDQKLKDMKDQLIRAKAYLIFALANSNSHLVKELKPGIKELELAIGESTKDSDLSKRVLQKSKAMEATLSKASSLYPDCPTMAKKLFAMTCNAEEQVRAEKNQTSFLVHLAGRTIPKGLHCLSMRLTTEYFALQPEEQKLPSPKNLHDPDLYHFTVLSDNVLACAAVVQSTISTAREPERIVFHVVTDSLNLPAISMWFLLNHPGKATIEVQSIDNFNWFSPDKSTHKENSPDTRYSSALNYIRFYLPDIFAKLNKIVLLDHDVIVQRDLTGLWSIDMKGKVNGALETCHIDYPSFHRMDMFINFSDPIVAMSFDVKACTWAFGLNIFDLREWRRRNLTKDYEKYLQLGKERPLWKAGSLPSGWITFYNQTVGLDRSWHVLGLGYQSGLKQGDVDQAAVIHYDGILKPWLDIGLETYKPYWRKHINYDHPFLRQCNIH